MVVLEMNILNGKLKEIWTKEGCLFYEQGCRGPMTHSSCNKIYGMK